MKIWQGLVAIGCLSMITCSALAAADDQVHKPVPQVQSVERVAAGEAANVRQPVVFVPEKRGCTILPRPDGLRGLAADNLWPDNTVYYAFDPGVSSAHQADAINAMTLIEGASAMHFVARTSEPDYVVFRESSGNNSFIGRIGGPQTINIFNWDIPFVIVHEVMHAMGIYHEHQRPDRDSFVQIEEDHVCGGSCIDNFTIENDATTIGLYDFDSVMHYGQCTLSACGNCFADLPNCRTITVLPPYDTIWQDEIGQSDHFSDGDIVTINTLYPPLSEPCDSVFGDLDDDFDVDLADGRIFQTCYDGSTAGRPECSCADKDVDESVDSDDVQAFVDAIAGPNRLKGACCDDGTAVCTDGTSDECTSSGVTYQGDGTACANVSCPVANPGACCDLSDLSCVETSQQVCDQGGGVFKGEATSCDGSDCPLEYENTNTSTFYLPLNSGEETSDDMTLAGTARQLVYYQTTVFKPSGSPFDVTVRLFTDCPGNGGQLIAGTTASFTNIATGSEQVLSHTMSPVTIPNTVWMEITADETGTGWIIGETAEIGSTSSTFGVNQSIYFCNATLGGTHAGFAAKLLCVE